MLVVDTWSMKTHASHCDVPLFLSKERGVVWIVWHQDPNGSSKKHSWNSFEDKEPLPSAETCETVHEADAGCEKTTKGSCYCDRTSKDGHTCCSLVWLVPEAEIHDDIGVKSGFCKTQEQSCHKQTCIATDGGCAKCDDS